MVPKTPKRSGEIAKPIDRTSSSTTLELETITAEVSEEAARRLRVAAALENLTTGQLLDRIIMAALEDLPTMVGQAWDYTRRKPIG